MNISFYDNWSAFGMYLKIKMRTITEVILATMSEDFLDFPRWASGSYLMDFDSRKQWILQ